MLVLLLFLIVMAIIIIGDKGKYWKFNPKGGALKRVKTKEEEESEEFWEEIEEDEGQEKEKKRRLVELFRQIESQVSQELSKEKSADRTVSLPNYKLFLAPGKDVQEFLRMITIELSKKRTEYLIVGLLDERNSPSYMLELKGRSVWVDYNIEEILRKAIEVNASNIVLVHNHPTFSKSLPNLEPSEQDISSGYSFYLRCTRKGLNFLGDFIVSKGYYKEFLLSLAKEAQNDVIECDKDKLRKLREVEETEEKKEKFQLIKDIPVFLVDEIPFSNLIEAKSLQQSTRYEKWTLFKIADYVGQEAKTVYSLIIQGRTPIVRRIGDKGQYLWLVRKKDFDTWMQRCKTCHEI